MNRLVPVCLAVWVITVAGRAGPTENAIMAAMRLSEQPNYSWVATISDDARTYDIVGKTVRGGFTRVKMPVINSVRRSLGRGVTDTEVDVIFRGNVACVLESEDGWKTPDELRRSAANDSPSSRFPGASSRAPLGSRPTGSRTRHRSASGSSKSAAAAEADLRAYSNLQLAISHPHEELGVIVSSHREMKVEGEIVTGVLTDLGAQLLLVRDGQEKITPLRAAGTFTLWIRDGIVVKYQVQLEGTLELDLAGGRRQVNVNQTTYTVLKDIGTTQFDVPEQARTKLGS